MVEEGVFELVVAGQAEAHLHRVHSLAVADNLLPNALVEAIIMVKVRGLEHHGLLVRALQPELDGVRALPAGAAHEQPERHRHAAEPRGVHRVSADVYEALQ